MKLKKWEIVLIIALFAMFCVGAGMSREAGELSDKLIRLHVVANSDSEEDQALKLRVRDAVLRAAEPILESAESREAAAAAILDAREEITAAALGEIEDSGFSYDISLTLCEEDFPTTEYDTFSLPSGRYLSLRVVIGAGEGHNWWCVVFPSVCTAGELTEETAAELGLSEEEYRLVTGETGGFRVKFRILEIIDWIRRLLFG